jgi:hypothetical protein
MEKKITEKELDAIYIYLEMMIANMNKEEQEFWTKLITEIDPENYDN